MLLVTEGLINCYIDISSFLLYFPWKFKLLEKKARIENGFEFCRWRTLISMMIERINISTNIKLLFLKNILLMFAVSPPIPFHFHVTSTISFAFPFPLFKMCGKKTIPYNTTSDYFSKTFWNSLFLIMIRDKKVKSCFLWDQWDFSTD